MSTLKPRRFKFNRDVIRSVRDFIPHEDIENPASIYLARKLLAAYLLCQVNSVNYPYSAIYRYVGGSAILSQGVQAFLEKSLELRFDWPEDMEEGFFYMVFNKETNGIAYAVFNKNEHHRGEILEEKYKPFKEKLKRRGILSLQEVNFLIEQVVAPRNHLSYFSEVHDPLSLNYWVDFLESNFDEQKEALRLVSHLKPFDEFGFEPPTQLCLDLIDSSALEPLADEMDELIVHFRDKRDVLCRNLIKTGEEH